MPRAREHMEAAGRSVWLWSLLRSREKRELQQQALASAQFSDLFGVSRPLLPSAPATWASSLLHKHTGYCPASSGPLHWPFPLLRTLFPQVPTRLLPSFPSGLYLNIMTSVRPSQMPLVKIPPPCFILFFFSSLYFLFFGCAVSSLLLAGFH